MPANNNLFESNWKHTRHTHSYSRRAMYNRTCKCDSVVHIRRDCCWNGGTELMVIKAKQHISQHTFAMTVHSTAQLPVQQIIKSHLSFLYKAKRIYQCKRTWRHILQLKGYKICVLSNVLNVVCRLLSCVVCRCTCCVFGHTHSQPAVALLVSILVCR